MKALVMVLLVILISPAFGSPPSVPKSRYSPKVGDILFQSLPRNAVVDAIEGATKSPYSHCGVVVKNAQGWHVLQALGIVQETPLKFWIGQGRDQKFDVYRLKKKHQGNIAKFIRAADEYKGRPYDIRYRMDDEKIYCSELIFKAYRDATEGVKLGKLVKLGSLDWGKHEGTIIAIEGSIPLERIMITPKDLAEAEQLEFVHSF